MLGMLLIFSMVMKAFVGSLVRSLITRSNLPVTGAQDSTLGMCSIWEMVCARSPLHLANMYPVRSFLAIFFYLKTPIDNKPISLKAYPWRLSTVAPRTGHAFRRCPFLETVISQLVCFLK